MSSSDWRARVAELEARERTLVTEKDILMVIPENRHQMAITCQQLL